VRLLSWNVAGRSAKLDAQAAAVDRREPDLLALQEVRAGTLRRWEEALSAAGLPHIADSSELLESRRNFNLIASRWPLQALEPLISQESGEEFHPERYLGAVVQASVGELELHNAHLPPGVTRGLIKVRTFETLYERLAVRSDRPRILCGDFNTPQLEEASGEVVTWADHHREHFDRWDAAERSILTGLAQWDLADVYRGLHGYEPQEASWTLRRGGRKLGRRFDHVFASRSLNAVSCEYIHGWREEGFSDHSAIEAEFDLR
jgi:exonuclease III